MGIYIYLFIISSSGLSCGPVGRLTHRNTQPPAVYICATTPYTHRNVHYIYDFVVRRRALLPAARPSALSACTLLQVYCVGAERRVRSVGSRRYLTYTVGIYLAIYVFVRDVYDGGRGRVFLDAFSAYGLKVAMATYVSTRNPPARKRRSPTTTPIRYIYIYGTRAAYNDIIIVYICIYR